VLRANLAAVPESADAHHALGLTLVRLGQRERARAVLARAAELAPDLPRYAFVYAVSLHSSGDSAGARRVLESLLARHPGYAPARDLLARIDAR
jgi:Flp pilus assembly protein TadD